MCYNGNNKFFKELGKMFFVEPPPVKQKKGRTDMKEDSKITAAVVALFSKEIQDHWRKRIDILQMNCSCEIGGEKAKVALAEIESLVNNTELDISEKRSAFLNIWYNYSNVPDGTDPQYVEIGGFTQVFVTISGAATANVAV